MYVSAQMAGCLSESAPWSQLIALGNIKPCTVKAGHEIALSPNLHLLPVKVPHRDEFSDTMAFVVQGPARGLFYCPDIDGWDGWDRDLKCLVSGLDVALLDGTFYSAGELPGRDLSQIPHPLVIDTAQRLAGVNCEVRLIHLNHSNPLYAPGLERAWLEAKRIGVGALGDRWRLD